MLYLAESIQCMLTHCTVLVVRTCEQGSGELDWADEMRENETDEERQIKRERERVMKKEMKQD